MAPTPISSRRRAAQGFFKSEFGRQSQGFHTEHVGILAGLKKAIALAAWFTVNNGAETANNVPD